MKKKKVILILLMLIWCSIFSTDFLCAKMGCRPIFCIKLADYKSAQIATDFEDDERLENEYKYMYKVSKYIGVFYKVDKFIISSSDINSEKVRYTISPWGMR